MLNSRSEELTYVDHLIDEVKFEEALAILKDLGNKGEFSLKDQLSTLLLKGKICLYKQQYQDALKIGEQAYQMSQELGLVPESVKALIGNAFIGFIGNLDKAFIYINDAEKRLNSISEDPSTRKLRRDLLFIKSWLLYLKGNIDDAEESARECLRLTEKEKLGNKLDLANNYILISYIYLNQSDFNFVRILDFAKKSMAIMEELEFDIGISTSSNLVAQVYYALLVLRVYRSKGGKRVFISEEDLNQGLIFIKKWVSSKQISNRDKMVNFNALGWIYYHKGEIDSSIKNLKQAMVLAKEEKRDGFLAIIFFGLGYAYRMKGKYDQSIETTKSSLVLAEKVGNNNIIVNSLILLVFLHLDKNSREQAQSYLMQAERYYEQLQTKSIKLNYLAGKALMLKTSGRSRNRAEAESLLRKILEDHEVVPEMFTMALISLCELYLEDLNLFNNLELLEDINPLIIQMLEYAEARQTYLYFAEAKLLQAKLALVQMNTKEAEKILVEAQHIAEAHNYKLLSMKISSEHDTLLAQLDVWNELKRTNAPISERVKLASIDGVIDRLKRKRTVEAPKLVDEKPTLLLIITEGGVLIFSYAFTDEWKFDEQLFGGFLTAFNSISDEVFSEGLDRVKFGQHTVLIEPVGDFSVCYLYKGQTYLAKQKLGKFSERIQKITSIWQTLEKYSQTNQVLEINDNASLESLITEIFVSKKYYST
ncbi:MAG: tetratricopeptide repeat protein [Promethearchaeota archaeon]